MREIHENVAVLNKVRESPVDWPVYPDPHKLMGSLLGWDQFCWNLSCSSCNPPDKPAKRQTDTCESLTFLVEVKMYLPSRSVYDGCATSL